MSHSEIIKCDLCGYQFKVYSRQETEIHDRDEYEVTNYYPLPEENAHLVHNYICDICYNNFGEIIKSKLIESGEKYLNEINNRKQKQFTKYLEELQKIDDENQIVKNYCNRLKSISSILELNEQEIKDLSSMSSRKYPYTQGATYYLGRAQDIEKRTKLNMKRIDEWGNDYNIEIGKYPEPYNCWDIISKEEFKGILLDCEIKNMNARQIIGFVENLD